MEAADVELTLETAVGPGPLGEYINELMARGLAVTIQPTEEYVKRVQLLREASDGEKEPIEG